MNNHPIEVLMETAMNSIKEMVDVNTIIGDPIETKSGMVIIPISKVCFGTKFKYDGPINIPNNIIPINAGNLNFSAIKPL